MSARYDIPPVCHAIEASRSNNAEWTFTTVLAYAVLVALPCNEAPRCVEFEFDRSVSSARFAPR